MAQPLAAAYREPPRASTPQTSQKYDAYEVQAFIATGDCEEPSTESSSPFVSCENSLNMSDQENHSPSKSRRSRVLSGAELSPLKILTDHTNGSDNGSKNGMTPPPSQSPRKLSPIKRFPVKVSNPMEATHDVRPQTMNLEDVVSRNDGLKQAIEIFEDEQSTLAHDNEDGPGPRVEVAHGDAEDEAAGPDDTMISTFSTFSAVPNMTMFAKLDQSPAKLSTAGGITPRARANPSPTRGNTSPIRGSRADADSESGNTTNLLMDFTDSLRNPSRSPAKRTNTETPRNSQAAGASSRYNLIDFDIPPMPTPRSVPSISAREMESLKSKFLSEISSLKASLSGKEAEVLSLKTAVGDAEKRVGESMEELRDIRASKEQLAAEKDDWETRGREMESVLRKVKEEIVRGQKDKEELEQKLDESEKRREAAEMMHQEAESKMAGMRAGKESGSPSPEKAKSPGSNREVEIAVERVARELHALYKSKHETKVAALKKSYESRWEKKIRELEAKIEELSDENDKLRRDSTLTKEIPGSAATEERRAQAVKDSAAIKELEADVQRLEAVVSTVQRDNEDLRGMLERERVEKGELVQLAEEMMSMQSFVGPSSTTEQTPHRAGNRNVNSSNSASNRADALKTPRPTVENLRDSIGRGSGLRAPGTALRVPHTREKSGGGSGGGLPRPGGIARSGIMSSIERMGSHRGRAAE